MQSNGRQSLLHVVQLLAGMIVGHAHGDERDDRDGHHVPGRRDGVARKVDQPERDERGRAAEDGVRQVKRKSEAGVAHVGRERLGEVAGQGAIVDGEQKAHEQLDDQNDPEVHRTEQHKCRHREHDEAHTGTDEHLLAAHLVGDAAGQEDEGDVDDASLGG